MALPHRPTGREHLCSARKGVAQSGESEARKEFAGAPKCSVQGAARSVHKLRDTQEKKS